MSDPFARHYTDDRIVCDDCRSYDRNGSRCMAARPPLARIHDLKHRCVYFNPLAESEDQRKGIERWPELKDAPGGPARRPYPDPRKQ